MTDKADTGKTDAAEEFIELGWKELRLQSETRDHLDTKTGVILGFALVSVVEVLGFLLLVGAEKDLYQGNSMAICHVIYAWTSRSAVCNGLLHCATLAYGLPLARPRLLLVRSTRYAA